MEKLTDNILWCLKHDKLYRETFLKHFSKRGRFSSATLRTVRKAKKILNQYELNRIAFIHASI